MLLTRIVIEGNKRLALSGIQRLEWTPIASYQMILGTNGSGKSSLMAELSPLPATPADYHKGGSKQVEIDHNGATYLLTSSFVSTSRHSFLKDGIELNEGGTAAIQKELAETHFRYTKELHELLTGVLLFTEMSVGERRKWITRLSQNDYTYALKLYEHFKTAARDMQGHLKHVRRRLLDEAAALQQMGENDDTAERVKSLQDFLSELLMHRVPGLPSTYQAMDTLKRSLSALEGSGASLEHSAGQVSLLEKERSLEALESALATASQAYTLNEEILARLHKEHEEITSFLSALQVESTSDPAELHALKLQLNRDIETQRASIHSFPGLLEASEPKVIQQVTQEVLAGVIGLFTQLPDNSDKHIAREPVENARALKRSAEDMVAHCESSIRVLRERLHVIEHAQIMECPQCRHAWTPGVHPHEIPELNAKIAGFQSKIAECEARIGETSKYLEEAEAYMALYRQWRGFVHQYPRLKLLWDTIQHQQLDLLQPAEHVGLFYTWQSEVEAAVSCFKQSRRLEEIDKLLGLLEKGEGAHLRMRLEPLEKEIIDRTQRKADLLDEQKRLRERREQLQALALHTNLWSQAMANLEQAYDSALEALANECLEKDIVTTQTQLGALQHALNARRVLEGVLAELQKDLERCELDFEALDLLTRELSPKEGLIAEQLHGFITCLTAQINSILSPVWTYELEVLPCGMDGGELDYQFPLQCGTNGPTPKDISLGSRSIKEMINFAFAQTAMLYMGLDHYPLFTDELGSSFDEAHRPAVHQFVSRLMESQRYSQVFMISHYSASYTAFHNAEYLVLDSRNIAVPAQYNHHASLT